MWHTNLRTYTHSQDFPSCYMQGQLIQDYSNMDISHGYFNPISEFPAGFSNSGVPSAKHSWISISKVMVVHTNDVVTSFVCFGNSSNWGYVDSNWEISFVWRTMGSSRFGLYVYATCISKFPACKIKMSRKCSRYISPIMQTCDNPSQEGKGYFIFMSSGFHDRGILEHK
jgi:hypothetical protein